MKYYFDIDFIRSFSKLNLSEFVYSDFIKFASELKHSLNKKIDCIIFHDEELQLSDLVDNTLYEKLSDTNISFRKKADLLNILEDGETTSFKFFFVDRILEGTDISKDYGFYSAGSHDLKIKWENVSSNCRVRKTLSNTPSLYNFTSWEDMSFCKLPFNCIVFSDRYFLQDRASFEINLFALLKTLGISALRKRKVDIFILSEVFRVNKKGEDAEIIRKKGNEQFIETFEKIQNFLNQIIGEDNYNFTLIKVDRAAQVKPHEVHDRLLYTNVLFMNPGNSFDFFKYIQTKPKVKAGTIINFDNFLWDGARGPNVEILNRLKFAFEKVSDQQETEAQGPIYRVLNTSDKLCRLFA
jgi:hypothetical protein